jgi:hypothetical protein
MTHDLHERYADLLETHTPRAVKDLIEILDDVCAPRTAPRVRGFDASLSRARDTRGSTVSRTTRQRNRMRTPLVAAAGVVLIVVGSALGYVGLRQPAPVSAAPLLREAARAAVGGPNGQVVHEIVEVRVSQPGGPGGSRTTIDRWTQLAPNGEARIDMTLTGTNPLRHVRLVAEAGGVLWLYEDAANTASENSWTPGTRLYRTATLANLNLLGFLKALIGGPQDPYAMRDLLAAAAEGHEGEIRLVPGKSAGNASVDRLEVVHTVQGRSSRGLRESEDVLTIDLDRHSHLVRRLELRGLNAQGSILADEAVDFLTYQFLPMSAVPTGTFVFTPRPGLKISHCAGTCKP